MSMISDALQDSSRVGTGWGFAVMILGVLAIMTPFVSGVAVTMLLAVLLTAAGLMTTMYAFKAGSFGKGALQFLFGGVTILCGVSMFFTPVESMMPPNRNCSAPLPNEPALNGYIVVIIPAAVRRTASSIVTATPDTNGVMIASMPRIMTANPQPVPTRDESCNASETILIVLLLLVF